MDYLTAHITGADPGFQVRGGAHLKKLCRAEGDTKMFGVFRVKNYDFTPKNDIFSNFRGRAPGASPLDPPLTNMPIKYLMKDFGILLTCVKPLYDVMTSLKL